MTQKALNKKIFNATKWSALTEILSKLITPVTSMIMARLLTPQAYGVIATFSIIIAFADVFADAGFQKYLIQREFINDDERDKHTNVAFWTNVIMSLSLWGVIIAFSAPLASLVGSPGLGHVLVVSCAGIPINGFCSIQMALMKRELDFKTLFFRRLVSIVIPIFVTIPLAIWLRNYWALVLGTLAMNLANAVFLSFNSSWRPCRYYSFNVLKGMLPFCTWSMIDSLLIWATVYIDIFFISKMLDVYYVGLYRTSISIVGQIVSLITATILPVVLPSLSRLQDNLQEMRRMLLKFQKITGIVIIPLGVGIFVFKNLITNIFLGAQWIEAAGLIGLWGLMEAITVVFARFCSPVYPAIGKPHVSVIVQLLHLVILIPAVIISGIYGFETLYVTRSLIRLELIFVNMIAVYILIKQSPWNMIVNILPQVVSALVMAIVGYVLLNINHTTIMSILWVIICIAIYFMSLYILFPSDRCLIKSVGNSIFKIIKR